MGGIFMERIFVLVVSKRISPQDSRTVPMVSRGVELSIFPERMSFQRLKRLPIALLVVCRANCLN